ncbi:MAG: hypothetical protein GTN36_01950 [Candidatus Aenigmarchaeota archaeon]|nr:hypothetical protein [Candidatus Aenigmarchaeota archaeon]
MIDKLLRANLIQKKPWYGIILGFLFASLGIIFASLIFRTDPSFPAIFLTTLAAAPLIVKLIKSEKQQKSILRRHEKIIEVYFYLFFGMTIAFAVFNAFLPDYISSSIFSEQLNKFSTGYFTGQSQLFFEIILNNLGLVLFFFILSLFYGSGSMFLLTWNSSILGVMWGNILKVSLYMMDPLNFVQNVFFIFPFLLPEIEAYFLASVAGGIVSVNLDNKKKLETAMNDSLIFLLLSIVLIVIAGGIEVILIA